MSGAAGQLGDHDERLARQRRGLIDVAAAAIHQRECAVAAVLRKVIRIGERQDRAHVRKLPSPLRGGVGGGGHGSARRLRPPPPPPPPQGGGGRLGHPPPPPPPSGGEGAA